MSRILGVDFGFKRIGLAVSDITETIATGLEVLHVNNKIDVMDYFRKKVINYEVSTIVIGLPKNMNGSLGEQSGKVIDFGDKLKEHMPEINIEYLDERLSTRQAINTLLEADMSRAKRKSVVDKVSAVIILQTYLDRKLREKNYAENDNSKQI